MLVSRRVSDSARKQHEAMREHFRRPAEARVHRGPGAAASRRAAVRRFGTLVLDGVPPLASCSADGRQRFANLVDVCCDQDVRLFRAADRGTHRRCRTRRLTW